MKYYQIREDLNTEFQSECMFNVLLKEGELTELYIFLFVCALCCGLRLL